MPYRITISPQPIDYQSNNNTSTLLRFCAVSPFVVLICLKNVHTYNITMPNFATVKFK